MVHRLSKFAEKSDELNNLSESMAFLVLVKRAIFFLERTISSMNDIVMLNTLQLNNATME